MALKVKAKEQLIKIGKYADTYRYVMMPELYTALAQDKVIKEAALRSGVSRGVMQACWDAAGEVIKAWATEGHSVALPGLGTMRFGLRAKSVAKVDDVKTGLITTRRIFFTPDVDLKQELASTAVQITCYDRTGKEVKRVTSNSGEVEEEPENQNQNETPNGSGSLTPDPSGSLTPDPSPNGEGSENSGSNGSLTGGNDGGNTGGNDAGENGSGD